MRAAVLSEFEAPWSSRTWSCFRPARVTSWSGRARSRCASPTPTPSTPARWRRTAFTATGRGGVVVPLGMTDRGATVDLPANDLAMRGREVRSCRHGNVDIRRDLPRFARVLEAGLLDPAAMVDRTYPLAGAGKALAAAEARELLTAVLLPQTDSA